MRPQTMIVALGPIQPQANRLLAAVNILVGPWICPQGVHLMSVAIALVDCPPDRPLTCTVTLRSKDGVTRGTSNQVVALEPCVRQLFLVALEVGIFEYGPHAVVASVDGNEYHFPLDIVSPTAPTVPGAIVHSVAN